MTMPHMSNCAHSPDGWCLACVKALWDQKESALAKLEEAEKFLNTWLVDNTNKVFEEQPEIDGARALLLEAIR